MDISATRRLASAFCVLASSWGILNASAAPTSQLADRPNIILIVTDDQGYGDVGYQGLKDIPTPNMDALARGGVRFSNGYVSCPVCSPTRAGLMTGRYQQRFGHEFNPGGATGAQAIGLPLTEVTIADRLKAAGYRTGMVGKWHLGNGEAYHPLRRGFEEFFGFAGGAHDYFESGIAGNAIVRGSEPVDEKEYLTDGLTREAVAFIKRHKSEPFFLYLAYNAVHAPLQAPEKYLQRFASITEPRRRLHAAMLSALDDGIGSVVGEVGKAGLDRRTLIFCLSDNGGPTHSTTSSNLPLRGEKGQVLEGGIRVPFVVQWKGHLPEGKVFEPPVISLDILPTALAAAGANPQKDHSLDGVDLLPWLTGKQSGPPHDALFWRMGMQSAVRKGDWKLVHFRAPADAPAPSSNARRPRITGPSVQLYDLASDIGETKNLAETHPDKVEELRAALEKWQSQLAKPLWQGKGKAKFDPSYVHAQKAGGESASTRPAARKRAAERRRGSGR